MRHRGEMMQKDDNIRSVLKLDKLVFDKIEFQRLGFQNDKEIELKIRSEFCKGKTLINIKLL